MSMQRLSIHGIECYSYHGCMEEEARIGGLFNVDLELYMDLQKAIDNDDLSDTADYVVLHHLVREEMNIRSKLIEHAAGRIQKRILKEYPQVSKLEVTVTKYNPPVNGKINSASITLFFP